MKLPNIEEQINSLNYKAFPINESLPDPEVFADQEILNIVNSKISILLFQELDWEVFTRKAISILGTNLNWKVANYWEVNLNKERIESVVQWESFKRNRLPVQSANEKYLLKTFAKGQGVPGQVWQSNKPIWSLINSRKNNIEERTKEYSTFGFPVYSGVEVIGVVEAFVNSQQNCMDPNLARFFVSLGGQLGWYKKQKDNEKRISSAREDKLNNKNKKFNYLLDIIRKNKAEY